MYTTLRRTTAAFTLVAEWDLQARTRKRAAIQPCTGREARLGQPGACALTSRPEEKEDRGLDRAPVRRA